MAYLFDTGIFSVVSAAGATLPGAKLYFYAAGTSTPQNTYSDMALTVPNLNPVVADANGRFSEIWMGSSLYKIILKDANDVTLETRDNVGDQVTVSLASTDLALGTALITYKRAAGFESMTLQERLNQEPITLRECGVIPSDTAYPATNYLAGMQSAIDAALDTGRPLSGFTGHVRVNDTLTIPDAIMIKGEGAAVNSSGSGDGPHLPTMGSWLFLDHDQYGLDFYNVASVGNSYPKSEVHGLGTYRDQGTPSGGWAPGNFAHDMHIGTAVEINNCFFLNPTKAAYIDGAGRLWANNTRGQPMTRGFECKFSSDVQFWNNTHWWPYWAQDADVYAHTIPNCSGALIERADGLRINQFFTYGCAWSINAIDATGVGSGLANFDFRGIYGDKAGGVINITSAYYAARGYIDGIAINSDSAIGGAGAGITINGAVASSVVIDGLECTRAHAEVLKASGAAHKVWYTPGVIEAWDRLATGAPAFSAANGAIMYETQTPKFSSTPVARYTQATSGLILSNTDATMNYTINDDNVLIIPLPDGSGNKTISVLISPTSAPGAGIPYGEYRLRGGSSLNAVTGWQSSSSSLITLTTGALTGTTGADTNFTISVNADNAYFENRSGANLNLTFTIKGR